MGDEPNGSNINDGCGANDLALLQRTVRGGEFDLGVAFDGDGDRVLAVDADGEIVDGDADRAVLALHLGVDTVAVTTMTNLGFHRSWRSAASACSPPTSATATCWRRCAARGRSSVASSRAT